ncbi:Translin [Sporodiniella umbellata]|nr:Translin [Sporodiniella umbellata]
MELNFFNDLQKSFEKDAIRRDEIRSVVKELDRTSRLLTSQLSQIHANPTDLVPTVDYKVAREQLQTLSDLVRNEFYRYHEMWSRVVHQLVFLVIFQSYLENGQIISTIIPTIESSLGGTAQFKVDIHNNVEGFHIPLEDILQGYISLINELSRLAVNCVTVGDYERPLVISQHVKELSSGFQLLNLKNDNIRKRFDSIKYDVKKIEEVVYDITLRGLHTAKKRTLENEEDVVKKRKE